MDDYHRMIYDWGFLETKFKGTCPLCNRQLENLDYHIYAQCTEIHNLRKAYSMHMYNELSSVYMKQNLVHDLKFAQEVVKWLRCFDINMTQQWWEIFSGANVVRANQLQHGYNIHKLTQPQTTFLFKLKARIMSYVSMIHRITDRPHVAKTYFNKYKKALCTVREWFPQILKNRIEWRFFAKQNKLNRNDIIVFTDGSFKEFQTKNAYPRSTSW